MQERRDEIREVATRTLGRLLSRGATGEYGMLAERLRRDEDVKAMALCRIKGLRVMGAQRLMAATPERLLFVEKALVSRRERFEEYAWQEILGATIRPPAGLHLELAGGRELELSLVQPADQLGVIADLARTNGEGGRFGDLLELARRKLGKFMSMGADPVLLGLAGVLAVDEDVVDLGYALGKPNGIVAVTSERLIFVPAKGFGAGDAVAEPYEAITEIRTEGPDGLLFEGESGSHLLSGIVPEDRALTIVERVAPRLRK